MTFGRDSSGQTTGLRLIVRGQVQGVGFRPFVYRLARECSLGGRVRNAPEGVVIEVEGQAPDLQQFETRLLAEAPAPAAIDGVRRQETAAAGLTTFAIDLSAAPDLVVVRVPRDLATCPACRREIFEPADRRHGYPFTNCTACGPRFSILLGLPYDRPLTAMRQFTMCAPCTAEYHAPDDRRFHAQPNACAACGPQIALWDRAGHNLAEPDQALTAAAKLLRQGQVLALKGLGGFQLLVRADQSEAVQRLRQRKCRPSKPLAVMVASLAEAERRAEVGALERQVLQSVANPIVLLKPKPGADLAAEIAPGVDTVGLFLPTTPLHHLLLAEAGLPVVATSGNQSEEPIVIDEQEALQRLPGIADAFLVHNRPVLRRVDDSVVRIIDGRPVIFRLARGYAPQPLTGLEEFLAKKSCPGPWPLFLATGGHQKAALALWTGAQAVLTQHLGDLDHPEARAAMEHAWEDLARLFHFQPQRLACDQHPDYFTTVWAQRQHQPIAAIQHHHAHAAAAMLEHGLLDEEVLAFTWDGTGFGPDGTIWGGEVLRVRGPHYQRVASLLPFPLPGGEAAIRQPSRIVIGLLWTMAGETAMLEKSDWPRRLGLAPADVRLLAGMMRRRLNSPLTSSMGRLFDAVAALVLGTREVSYEGEAAVWLEAAVEAGEMGYYPLPLQEERIDALPRGDWRPLLAALLQDLDRDVTPGVMAARFHNALVHWALAVAQRHPGLPVVLSGGCFQNRLLAERTAEALRAQGRKVYGHAAIPPGDGGLAAGQLAVALAGLTMN